MADKRIRLDDQNLDDIVGGAFKFYNQNGQGYCKVSDVTDPGKYLCRETGVYEFMQLRANNPGLSGDEYLALGLQQGILWKDE